MKKNEKQKSTAAKVSSTRELNSADAARFAAAVEEYIRVHASSKEAALKKLTELGFLDASGNPSKNYR